MMFPYPVDPNIDMSTWGDGPWQQEPSAISWVDGRTGLNCAIIRHPEFGGLCGYVAVEPGHPLHGLAYRDRVPISPDFLANREAEMGRDFGVMDLFIESFESDRGKISVSLLLPAHGGITYSAGDTEDFWWFGFDTAHVDDVQPGLAALMRKAGFENPSFAMGTYRDKDYVHGIVTRLAWALHEYRVNAVSEQNRDANHD